MIKLRLWVLLVALSVLVAGCSSPATQQPTQQQNQPTEECEENGLELSFQKKKKKKKKVDFDDC